MSLAEIMEWDIERQRKLPDHCRPAITMTKRELERAIGERVLFGFALPFLCIAGIVVVMLGGKRLR